MPIGFGLVLQRSSGQICCFAEHIKGEHFAVQYLKGQYGIARNDLHRRDLHKCATVNRLYFNIF